MTFNVFLAFAAFCFVSSATPGPNNLMLMASGANFGIRRTVPHWLGIGTGFTVMVIVVGLGLMNVFEMFPVIYKILKTLSVAFLVYLAWKIANAAPLGETGTVGQPMTFLQAVAFQWVNPKAWAMALTAISVYSPSNSVAAVVTTALIFGLINLPSCSIWMFVGRQIHRFLTNPLRMRVFNIVMSLLLLTSLYPLLFSAH
ncbi:LysE family translocator [bacterium AH-315-J23]|nr:LysE family translocator [bacterium AH-315-J23]PHQ67184.1 MAG: hypothetical protein COB92_05360 [Robiginitomaculum sp.]